MTDENQEITVSPNASWQNGVIVNPSVPYVIAQGKTERDVAMDLKARLTEACGPILSLAREANANELDVQLSFSRDAFGQLRLEPIILRRY